SPAPAAAHAWRVESGERRRTGAERLAADGPDSAAGAAVEHLPGLGVFAVFGRDVAARRCRDPSGLALAAADAGIFRGARLWRGRGRRVADGLVEGALRAGNATHDARSRDNPRCSSTNVSNSPPIATFVMPELNTPSY